MNNVPIKIKRRAVCLNELLARGVITFEKPRIVWVPEKKMWRAFKPSDPEFWVELENLSDLVHIAYHGATMESE
ncbi:hypothetical protein F406_gp050 [Agrobacterium phage 7-7-1]|uniref:Uncharacterized protein n=1 Tax=Agrobacterium phage 7-7-1 TaxID=1161931 RepID=J7F8Y6_9CAUD|nr:hypothetical protein F406_gp050 [Agrobacterium phage 7-7-1]AFH19765.1 hypothetical protein 7-7-1_00067 [Agrobacterium phage 7-7-1]